MLARLRTHIRAPARIKCAFISLPLCCLARPTSLGLMRIKMRISEHFLHRAGGREEWPHFCASSASLLSADYDDENGAHFEKYLRYSAYMRISAHHVHRAACHLCLRMRWNSDICAADMRFYSLRLVHSMSTSCSSFFLTLLRLWHPPVIWLNVSTPHCSPGPVLVPRGGQGSELGVEINEGKEMGHCQDV